MKHETWRQRVPDKRQRGGSAGDDDFNADAYLSGLEKLVAAGVTWVQASVPGDSLAHVVETIERFGKSVIASA